MRRKKSPEECVFHLLRASNIQFQYNHPVQFLASAERGIGARVDFIVQKYGHEIYLEIDEHQHISYNNEFRRMVRIVEARNARERMLMQSRSNKAFIAIPKVFIRFNPDVYNKSIGMIPIADREACLIALLDDRDSPIYTKKSFAIQFMYYDTNSHGELAYHTNDYHKDVVDHCLSCIE